MGSGSAVRAGIHAGLGRSGKGECVLIDKTGQVGVLRESPQPCCPLSPHRAPAVPVGACRLGFRLRGPSAARVCERQRDVEAPVSDTVRGRFVSL